MMDTIGCRSRRDYCICGWTLLLAVCSAATLVSCASPQESPQPATKGVEANAVSTALDLEGKWGIQFSGVCLSAGGNIVDFRYKVMDPVKAAFLTKPENKPQLVDLTSGAKLVVPDSPDVGPLRQTSRPFVSGKMYFMLFANTRHHVKSGDKVTITAGDLKLENLTVE